MLVVAGAMTSAVGSVVVSMVAVVEAWMVAAPQPPGTEKVRVFAPAARVVVLSRQAVPLAEPGPPLRHPDDLLAAPRFPGQAR